MTGLQISTSAQKAIELADSHSANRAMSVLGGAEKAQAAVTWAKANLPPDDANVLLARMNDPNDGANAAAELRDLHAAGVRDSTVNQSVAGGGLRPEEVKAAMNRAAAGDAIATRKLKATPMSIIDAGLGINPNSTGPIGMVTI